MDRSSEAPSAAPKPLKLSRILHARRETVFKAWGAAEHVKRWFAPETFVISEARVDMRVGGAFGLCMRSPGGEEHWIRGAFVEVRAHDRLAIDMTIEDGDGKRLFGALTEVEFADALGGTRIDVTQSYTVLDPSKAWMIAGAPE